MSDLVLAASYLLTLPAWTGIDYRAQGLMEVPLFRLLFRLPVKPATVLAVTGDLRP